MRLVVAIVTALVLQISLAMTHAVTPTQPTSLASSQATKSSQSRKFVLGKYTLTDIGAGNVAGINSAGQVACNLKIGDGGHAFIYSSASGDKKDIGNFDARGINDKGAVCGNMNGHVVFFYNGTIHDLGIPLGGSSCRTYALNIHGMITGQYKLPNGHVHAFLYDPANPKDGGFADIGTLGGSPDSAATDMSYGSSINDAGQVEGDSINAKGEDHCFVWTKGVMVDVGTLGGPASSGMVINNAGHATGTAQLPGSGKATESWISHLFFYDGKLHDCGTLGGKWANSGGINDDDVIVGWSTIAPTDTNTYHAFIYANGVMTDLNSLIPANSGFTLNQAGGINSTGQIVVNGVDSAGKNHALLLDPVR
jgi:probable HAF family extracellular repeat protein